MYPSSSGGKNNNIKQQAKIAGRKKVRVKSITIPVVTHFTGGGKKKGKERGKGGAGRIASVEP